MEAQLSFLYIIKMKKVNLIGSDTQTEKSNAIKQGSSMKSQCLIIAK